MTSNGFIGAIDLGGTKILSIIVDRDMQVVASDLRPTKADLGPDGVIARMVASVSAAADGRRIEAIGISTAGLCNPEAGVVTESPNLPGWHDIPLARKVSEALHLPVWIENDANAAAIAEHRLGAGREVSHLLLVALGTGIGGGLILNGRIYRGASGAAGEIGHMLIVPDGPVCGCGRRGCLEAMASGIAFGREAAAIVAREPEGILAQLSHDEEEGPTAVTLEKAAAAGDTSATQAIRQAGLYLGAGLTNLVNIFNPELIAVSGNLRKTQGYLEVAKEVVWREAFEQSVANLRIEETDLGDDAAAFGAALVALDALGR